MRRLHRQWQAGRAHDVSIHPGDPIDGKPVEAFVFTVSPQAGVTDVITDAYQGKLGDAIIIRVQEDGTLARSRPSPSWTRHDQWLRLVGRGAFDR
ncbi:MAG TPA: hypothetical protein VGI95_03300 [Caulobacteraceae bacterium]|jgi:hypothetical protein